MNKQFLSLLTKFEDYEFFTLEHHLNIARMIRNTMSTKGVDENTMASILNVPIKKMREVVTGAYPFDLRLLSKLQSYNQEIAANDAKIKIEAESIGFSKYKDQYPIYVNRIEKLLEILEKQDQIK